MDIRHLLTAPRSPTTTGKVERFHKTLRAEFLGGNSFASIAAAQAALDAWVTHYNCRRPHQGIGMVAPLRRFAAGEPRSVAAPPPAQLAPSPASAVGHGVVRRLVGATGKISYCGTEYRVGAYLGAERVEVAVVEGLVEVRHHGVLVAPPISLRRRCPTGTPCRVVSLDGDVRRKPPLVDTPEISKRSFNVRREY